MTDAKEITKLLYKRRRLRRSKFVFTLNLAPMMDVMFNLLVFFLVTTSFTLPEGLLAAKLPRTTGISQDRQLSVPVVPIKIFLEPAANVGARHASPSFDESTTTIKVSTSLTTESATRLIQNFEDLYSFMNALSKNPGFTPETPVIIAAKSKTNWQTVVNAYNTAMRAKFKNIVFASWK